ncbi:magnesium transporter [Prauserella cavernicola]|uniref:Magnesium transporter n=1 Tax=Prauserella cavernicola TaxID=2800127 RepID=A0A934QZN0_9PSEU|nr:magnesium transporter [Prauserella cavernicola]MBK1789002.1 magnesium transporter [Prauserella cavernicola]
MNTVLTLLVVFLCAWGWHRARDRRKRGEGPGRGRKRLPALIAAIAMLGLQAVVTAPPAMAQGGGCEAPNPERPGSGMVGAIDPTKGQGEAGSAYLDYGYAGMVWNVYDCDNGALGITDPNTTVDTWAGNQLFNIGKNIVGATNSLHYTVLEGGLLNPIYNAVSQGAEAVYNNIYAQLFGLAALILALIMFRNIWRGDLSTVSKRALLAIGGLWLAASSMALLRYYDEIDRAIVQTTTNIQAGFVDETEDRVVRHVLPTDLHDKVVYENWLRGTFGSPEAPQAEQFGRPLLDAQAFTWEQMRGGDDADENVINGKKEEFKNISTQLGPAAGYFTGEDGSRTGAGFLSMLQSLAYALFQLFAKAAVLLAQILVRLFTLTAPLIGLVAILHHDILRRVGKVIGSVAFNLIVLSVLAGVHALLLQAIFAAGNSLSMLTQMALAGLVTILLFLVGRPARRLWQMVEMSVSMVGSAVPTPRGGLFSRLRKKSDEPTPQDEFWRNVRDDDEAAGGTATRGHAGATNGARFRPEATVFANSQRLDPGGNAIHPARHWPGQVGGGMDQRPGLPAGGSAPAGAFSEYTPGRSPGDYMEARPVMMASRRVDTAPVTDRGWDREDPDPLVVPSRMASTGVGEPAAQAAREMPNPPPPPPPGAAAAAPQQPRRVEPELVAGKPVFVLYRPSRGLEVRGDDARDTDHLVR